MTTARGDLELSPFLKMAQEFLQNDKNRDPNNYKLERCARVIQDTFKRGSHTPLTEVGLEVLAESRDLAFNSLRGLHENLGSVSKLNERELKNSTQDLTELFDFIVKKEQEIYQEIKNMSPTQFAKVFGNIPKNTIDGPAATQQEVAEQIARGYGMGLIQHYGAMYGEMATSTRGLAYDVGVTGLMRNMLYSIAQGDTVAAAVTSDKPVTVSVSGLVDEYLNDREKAASQAGKTPLEDDLKKINANRKEAPTKFLKTVPNEITQDDSLFNKKLSDYVTSTTAGVQAAKQTASTSAATSSASASTSSTAAITSTMKFATPEKTFVVAESRQKTLAAAAGGANKVKRAAAGGRPQGAAPTPPQVAPKTSGKKYSTLGATKKDAARASAEDLFRQDDNKSEKSATLKIPRDRVVASSVSNALQAGSRIQRKPVTRTTTTSTELLAKNTGEAGERKEGVKRTQSSQVIPGIKKRGP